MLFRRILKVNNFYGRYVSSVSTTEDHKSEKVVKIKKAKNHKERIDSYFSYSPHLVKIKDEIPQKYLHLKKRNCISHLYLLDKQIAKSAVSHMDNRLGNLENKLICDTNAGFGFITEQLLKKRAKVRVYEMCPEFRKRLKSLSKTQTGRIEIYTKDIYHLSTMSYIDKMDKGNRVQTLLDGIPKKPWLSDPAITIVGPMPQKAFLMYLIRMTAHQAEIIDFGRVEMFAFLRSSDFRRLTASPEEGCNVYQSFSILFQLFFDYKLLDSFDRKAFVPWEMKNKGGKIADNEDDLYLVHIALKRRLPVQTDLLLPLYYFIKQGYGKGRKRVISTIEKWLPGCGINLLVPKYAHKQMYFDANLNIFTEFGDLSPTDILFLFLEMVNHPEYKNSPFVALMEADLLKSETIESDTFEENQEQHNEKVEEVRLKVLDGC